MSFQFLCPQGHLLETDMSQVGQPCKCPYCGTAFLVPAAAPGGASEPRLPTFQPPAAAPGVPAQTRPKFELPPAQPLSFGAPGAARASGNPAPQQPHPSLPLPPAPPGTVNPGVGLSAVQARSLGTPGGNETIVPPPDESSGPPTAPAPTSSAASLPPGGIELPFDPFAKKDLPFDLSAIGEPRQESPPAELNLPSAPSEAVAEIHIPCPSGHLLEVPRDAIGQHAMCPFCGLTFLLRTENSVEYRQALAKRQKVREREEEKAGQVWLGWAIAAAVLVVAVVFVLLVLSGRQ